MRFPCLERYLAQVFHSEVQGLGHHLQEPARVTFTREQKLRGREASASEALEAVGSTRTGVLSRA